MTQLLIPGVTCWRDTSATSAHLLVDARDYYLAFYQAVLRAQRYLLIAGWQFDSRVALLRGADARDAAMPFELLPLLEEACRQRPELEVRILAWDYSAVLALEREWMQRLVFDWMTPKGIMFRFDARHPPGASHHEKFVVVDGHTAFLGGVDLARSRWDDRRHQLDNVLRTERGTWQKPYHDTMAMVTGPVVRDLESRFGARWQHVTGEDIQIPPAPPAWEFSPLAGALSIDCERVAISRTGGEQIDDAPPKMEIRALHESAVLQAERLVYVETQYFTATCMYEALVARLEDRRLGPLQVVIVMPRGADSKKEAIVLGEAQDELLDSLRHVAAKNGSELRVLFSAAADADGQLVPTFIHSKILIVDDRLLSVGSANWTNRSMCLDTELNLSWECENAASDPGRSIAAIRESLLAEHAGLPEPRDLSDIEGLVERLDALTGTSKLHRRPLSVDGDPGSSDGERLLRIERIFDPDRPLTKLELDDLVP